MSHASDEKDDSIRNATVAQPSYENSVAEGALVPVDIEYPASTRGSRSKLFYAVCRGIGIEPQELEQVPVHEGHVGISTRGTSRSPVVETGK